MSVRTVRHAACCLFYCCEPENPPEGVLRKQILVMTPRSAREKIFLAGWSWDVQTLQMARNTGRTWLDCKDLKRADNFLNLAVKVNCGNRRPSHITLFLPHFFSIVLSPEPWDAVQTTDFSRRRCTFHHFIQRGRGEGTAANSLLPGRVGEL